jgi:hypothetical protein
MFLITYALAEVNVVVRWPERCCFQVAPHKGAAVASPSILHRHSGCGKFHAADMGREDGASVQQGDGETYWSADYELIYEIVQRLRY